MVAGCSKPTVSTDNPEPQSSSSGTSAAPAPAPAPAPLASSTAPDKTSATSKAEPPPPPAKVLAPEGTLFALQRISITTDEGVFSVPGGTTLKIVRKTDTGYLVSDGKREFPVEASQVTNEVHAGTSAAQTHQAQSTAIAATNQANAAAQLEVMKTKQAEAAIQAAAAEKSRQIQLLEARNLALTGEIADLNSKISQNNAEAQRSWEATRIYGRVSGRVTADPGVVAGWQRRLAVAVEEKRRAEAEITRLQYYTH